MIKYGSVEVILQSDNPEDLDKIYEYLAVEPVDADVETFEIRKYLGGTVLKITLTPEPELLEGLIDRLISKGTLHAERDEIDIAPQQIRHPWAIFNSTTGKWERQHE